MDTFAKLLVDLVFDALVALFSPGEERISVGAMEKAQTALQVKFARLFRLGWNWEWCKCMTPSKCSDSFYLPFEALVAILTAARTESSECR